MIGWSRPNHQLSGTLTNSKSEVVSGASIYVLEKEVGVTADASGNFELPALKTRDYTSLISVPGYTRLAQKIRLTEDQKKLELSVYLDAHKIKEVEVFGIKDAQPKKWTLLPDCI